MSGARTRALRAYANRACAIGVSVALAAGGALSGCSVQGQGNAPSSQAATTTDAEEEDFEGFDLDFTDRDSDASYDESTATTISLTGSTALVGDGASGVSVDGSSVTITQEGVYVISGKLDDGQIVVRCNEEDAAKVQLVLNDVSVHNSDGPAIRVDEAKKCFVTLADGSSNSLSDGSDYLLDDGSDEPYATVYSKCDLTLQGTGALEVTASYRHGIVSKDELVVTGGNYVVTAPEDALRGRDCVKVSGGSFELTSGESAIKSNNDEDESCGYVYIAGGTFNISAGKKGVHAETLLLVDGGSITVSESYEGLEGAQVYVRGGNIDITASDDGINASDGSGSEMMGPGDKSNDTPMGKEGSERGDRTDAHDMSPAEGSDTDEGNGSMGDGPRQGQPSEAAPDTAEREEGTPPTTDGDPAKRTGASEAKTSATDTGSDLTIAITGGSVHINAEGDGVDSNGSISISGGTLTIDGPTNGGDGAIDYETTATVTGGTVIAVGSAGMAESFTDGTQPFAMVNVNGKAGSLIEVKDTSGNVVASMTAAKQFGNVVVSSPGLANGSTCTLEIDGAETQISPSTEAQGQMTNGRGH